MLLTWITGFAVILIGASLLALVFVFINWLKEGFKTRILITFFFILLVAVVIFFPYYVGLIIQGK